MIWTTRPRSNLAPLRAICAGHGPRIVLLHGVGLRAEAWNPVIDALVEHGYQVIAPDMPGHGSPPMHLADVAAYAEVIRRALPEDGCPTVCIGHSMGAMIALDLAENSPEAACGVVAVNAVFNRSPAASHAVVKRAGALDGRRLPDPAPTLQRWFGERPSAERERCESWLTSVDAKGYQQAYRCFASARLPSRQSLQNMQWPSLFVTGAQDPNSTAEMSQHMAKIAPNGHSEIIQDAAHMMPMTHAAQLIPILLPFLETCFDGH